MKKAMILLLVCSLFVVSILSASATDADQAEPTVSNEGSRFVYIATFRGTFNIDSGGKATMSASVVASGVDSCKVTIYLQRYISGAWTVVNQWSETEAGTSCILQKEWYVTSGYSYRMKAYGNVYINDIVVEGDSIISQTELY